MPGKTGLDLLIELRRRQSSVPVLMMSGYADEETEAAARELGAMELLKKPVRRRQLIETAAQFVRSR
jgi:two-component system C4-dicarboxylate transport response regulator DctD